MFCVFPRVIAPDVCEEIVKDCKQNTLEEAEVHNYSEKKRGKEMTQLASYLEPKVRKTLVCYIKDKNNKINKLVWGFLKEANRIQFNYDLEYFQATQFAEYKDGGFYGWHQDDTATDKSNKIRKLSLTLVLSNPNNFEGGELQFYNGGRPMADMGEITGEQVKNDIKSQGTVIVFDSRDFHRVTPIVNGIRHSLVAWAVGPNFK